MKTFCAALFTAALICGASALSAQTATVDHYSPSDLAKKVDELKPQATAKGFAGTTLEKYPNHYSMLAVRTQNGGGELHQKEADIFYVVQGTATLLTGGSIPDGKTTAPGEIRGTAVKGGKETPLAPGDIVHIPANTPHQLVLPAGTTFVYFIFKVKESD